MTFGRGFGLIILAKMFACVWAESGPGPVWPSCADTVTLQIQAHAFANNATPCQIFNQYSSLCLVKNFKKLITPEKTKDKYAICFQCSIWIGWVDTGFKVANICFFSIFRVKVWAFKTDIGTTLCSNWKQCLAFRQKLSSIWSLGNAWAASHPSAWFQKLFNSPDLAVAKKSRKLGWGKIFKSLSLLPVKTSWQQKLGKSTMAAF